MPAVPRFKQPPVVETVLSLQFEPLIGFRVVHFGLLGEKLPNFPTTEEQPPLPPVIEVFSKKRRLPLEALQQWNFMAGIPLPRVLYKKMDTPSSGNREMIQVQPDRFIHNWARSNPQQPYPTYRSNRKQFLDSFEEFSKFVAENSLGTIKPTLAEVSYINRIPINAGERVPDAIKRTFAGLPLGTSDSFLPPSDTVYIEQSFPIEARGRLQLVIRAPVELQSDKDVIDFRLTARVGSSEERSSSSEEMLDLAHGWVVNGFKSATTPEMHRHWEVET